MARQGIFTGFTPNDGLGDSLALGASKVNQNFSEIYSTFGDGTNLSVNAGSAGTWTKAGNSGIYTSKNVGIGTTDPTASLFVSGNVQLTGITTGTFVGDGSGLTGVTAVGQGVVIKDSGTLVGVAQSLNLDKNLTVTQVFGGNVTVSAADTVGFAYTSGFSTTSAYATVSGVSTTSGTAGFADTATLAYTANFATVAGVVTYAQASGIATNSGIAEYAKVAGIASYVANAGFSTMAGYAHTAGIATVAQNLTGTPSINIDNINSAIGIVTMPGQGSKMRFDFDATGDLPQATSWRGMFAWANNTKTAYVSSGTTMGGYNGWRKLLHQDHEGNYFTVGVITASKFAGDGSELTNLPSTDSIWRTNSTGIHTLSNVGLGTTNTEGYKLKVVGNLKLSGRLDGTATDNILPHLWSTYSSLPSPTTYHGQFAHAHDTGKAYFAHAGAWMELINKNTDNTVGTGTEHYRVGVLTATSFIGDGSGISNINVSYAASAGIATLAQGLDGKPDILVANINCTGITTSATFVGDGSGLTGITASGSGIIIREDGTLVGTIGTVNFGTGFDVSPASAGVVTVTTSGGGGGGISGIVYQEEGSTVGTAQTVNFIGAACTVTHSGGVATVNLAGAIPFTGPAANITALDITQYEAAYGWGDHSGAGYLTGIGGQNLGNLSNVSSASPSTSDVLTWGGSSWVPAASSGGIIIKEEGSQVAAGITSLNFVGSTVSATASGTDGTITITAGGGGGGSISTTGVGTYTASAGVEQQVDSWSKLSYSGAEYTFMIGLGTFRQSQKVLVMHDGTTAFSQEYGIMFSPEQQVSIAATVSSNNVLVKVTPEAGISGLSTYRFVKTFIENL
tara:strand:- start:2399 stop:4948 length:2550 start_codon:yes stop_codon:yes gene_type:complete